MDTPTLQAKFERHKNTNVELFRRVVSNILTNSLLEPKLERKTTGDESGFLARLERAQQKEQTEKILTEPVAEFFVWSKNNTTSSDDSRYSCQRIHQTVPILSFVQLVHTQGYDQNAYTCKNQPSRNKPNEDRCLKFDFFSNVCRIQPNSDSMKWKQHGHCLFLPVPDKAKLAANCLVSG